MLQLRRVTSYSSASRLAAAPQQRQQRHRAEAAEAAPQPSFNWQDPMEPSNDDEDGAQLSVTPDGTDSQSGDLYETSEEQQPTSKKRTEQSEDAAERAERRIYEDEVLERARAIEKARAATSKACPITPRGMTPSDSRGRLRASFAAVLLCKLHMYNIIATPFLPASKLMGTCGFRRS